MANFHARFVFGLDDEELSMALGGTPAALTLCGPARLLARLSDRPAIEVSGARLEDGARQELLEALDGFGRTSVERHGHLVVADDRSRACISVR